MPQDKLEADVEQADKVQEQIDLAITKAESGLRSLSGYILPTPMTLPKWVSVRGRSADHISLEPPAVSATTSGSPLSPTTTSATMETSTTAPPITASSVSLSHLPRVKLPELTIKKFTADLAKWNTFWDMFESSVHKNPTLSDVDKFSYFVSFLESAAAEAISGLALTSANYKVAIITLNKWFGN